MIRGYAPHIWENKLESDKRRDTALLLAAELDDRKVAVVRRLRCALSRLLLESEQVRAVPSAQSKKEPLAALFLCAAARLAVWKYGGGRLPHNLHPNPQPSAKRDMAAPSKYGLCLRRRPKKSRLRLFFFARQPAAYAAEHLIRRDKLGTFPHWGRQRITSAFMQCAKFRLFQWFCGNCILAI